MTELFEMARDAMDCNELRKQLPAGVILTGGGALLPGATELAQQVFGLPVHLGNPSGMTGWADRVNSPKFATAVGLLHYARRLRKDGYAFAELPGSNDSTRRVWGVPLELNAAPLRAEKSENVFFDPPVKNVPDHPAEIPMTPPAGVTDMLKSYWNRFTVSIQPAVERVRQWLGFDVE
jgi:cell division ATPase FtsA